MNQSENQVSTEVKVKDSKTSQLCSTWMISITVTGVSQPLISIRTNKRDFQSVRTKNTWRGHAVERHMKGKDFIIMFIFFLIHLIFVEIFQWRCCWHDWKIKPPHLLENIFYQWSFRLRLKGRRIWSLVSSVRFNVKGVYSINRSRTQRSVCSHLETIKT